MKLNEVKCVEIDKDVLLFILDLCLYLFVDVVSVWFLEGVIG